MNLLLGTLALLGIVIGAAALVAWLVSLIVRDKSHGTSGSLSRAALEVQSLLDPSKAHMVETQDAMAEDSDEDGKGEPPR